jgi:hypothetical protein
MLGRLEMGVDECIDTYTRMFERVFSKKGLPVTILGKVRGRFDSIVLEECIVSILKERGLSRDELLNSSKACRVLVCLKSKEHVVTNYSLGLCALRHMRPRQLYCFDHTRQVTQGIISHVRSVMLSEQHQQHPASLRQSQSVLTNGSLWMEP